MKIKMMIIAAGLGFSALSANALMLAGNQCEMNINHVGIADCSTKNQYQPDIVYQAECVGTKITCINGDYCYSDLRAGWSSLGVSAIDSKFDQKIPLVIWGKNPGPADFSIRNKFSNDWFNGGQVTCTITNNSLLLTH